MKTLVHKRLVRVKAYAYLVLVTGVDTVEKTNVAQFSAYRVTSCTSFC